MRLKKFQFQTVAILLVRTAQSFSPQDLGESKPARSFLQEVGKITKDCGWTQTEFLATMDQIGEAFADFQEDHPLLPHLEVLSSKIFLARHSIDNQ